MRLGQRIPNFVADTTHGRIAFHEWLGDAWCVLFSHPADFTPVCTSELTRLAESHSEFWQRGVKLLALSCDRLQTHNTWVEDLRAFCRNLPAEFPYPIIADDSRELAVALDMIDEDQKDNPTVAMTVRSLYVIAPDYRVKLTMQYPNTTGRSVSELLRVVDSLQLTSRLKLIGTPSDWQPGNQVMVLPHVKTDDLPTLFPSGVETAECPSGKSYIRTTNDVWQEPWRTRYPRVNRDPSDLFNPTLAAQAMDKSAPLIEAVKFIEDVSRLPNLRRMPLADLMEYTATLVTEASSTEDTSGRLQAMTKFLRTLT